MIWAIFSFAPFGISIAISYALFLKDREPSKELWQDFNHELSFPPWNKRGWNLKIPILIGSVFTMFLIAISPE